MAVGHTVELFTIITSDKEVDESRKRRANI